MSNEKMLPSFIKWGSYKSVDAKNPDILELKVVETTTFETEYSTNAKVQIKDGTGWKDSILTLKSHASANAALLKLWEKNVEKGVIKPGKEFRLKTWLGMTKTTNRPIRRFAIAV